MDIKFLWKYLQFVVKVDRCVYQNITIFRKSDWHRDKSIDKTFKQYPGLRVKIIKIFCQAINQN